MLPLSPVELSSTYSDQVPFGLVPVNAERVEPYGGAGAGATKLEANPSSVGLKVPETMGPLGEAGNDNDAASSNVSITLATEYGPPVPPISTAVCPAGPASKASISFGNWWLRLVIVTVTLLTSPANPETLIVEGYGTAGPWSGIVMDPPLPNVLVAGRLKKNETVPRFAVPS